MAATDALWLTGRSPSGNLDASASSMEFTGSALGEVDCAQATHIPSRQSIMGFKQALPAGMENSVMSVGQRRFGSSAWKSCFTMFSGASPISPLQELCLRLLGRLAMLS